MACLTPEQLAALALGLDVTESSPHVDECPACQARLTELRRLTHELAAAHAGLVRNHAASRAQLLARLSHVDRRARTATTWKRFAFGGLGLSSAVAALFLIAFFATSFNQLSAMERMMKAVREVSSYSFNEVNHTTFVAPGGEPETYHRGTNFVCWRAPDEANREWLGDLHGEVKGWRCTVSKGVNVAPDDDNSDDDNSAAAARSEKLTLHLVETHPTGKTGIIIVDTEGYYFWVPPVRAGEIPVDNTIAKLRAVQQGQDKIVRDLGTKRIDGREARGYVLSFEDAVPFRGDSSIEVWVDSQTDLPMELSYERISDEEEGKYIDEYRLTDIRWNIDFPPNQFATIVPAGLINTTPPKDEKDIAEIVAALRFYAELSGGHYPRVRTIDPGKRRDPAIKSAPPDIFDGGQVHDEMLKLAGFTGPPHSNWDRDPRYQQVEAATPGLDSLTRVLLDRHHAGFFGAEVSPQEIDKVLLWCNAFPEGSYRIIYGDLRTEVVSEAKWKELVPSASQD